MFRLFCDDKLFCSKIEGSKATAKLTAELLRSFISQQRLPQNNQAAVLIEAVKTVGEKLIAANPVGMRLFRICCSCLFSCNGDLELF